MTLSPFTFELTLSRAGRTVRLYPRFVADRGGHVGYYRDFAGDGDFIGWMPYPVKQWPLSTDKLLFKRFAFENGIRVTAHWLDQGAALAPDFIVKPVSGSFGKGIGGPYGLNAPLPKDFVLKSGHFFEQFIRGRSAKAWYWNGEPIALELLPWPSIVGDGRRSLREIATQPRGNFDIPLDLDDSGQILAWQGYAADAVVENGVSVALDFRYMTPHDRVTMRNRNVWGDVSSDITAQFAYAGPVFYAGIPEALRRDSVFTLDAVVDADNRVWFLEMNSHPMIHPNVYEPMLLSLFDEAADIAEQGPVDFVHAGSA